MKEASLSSERSSTKLMRNGLVPFTRMVFEIVAPGERLHLNWHVRAIAHALEQVRQGKLKRLIITVPPRHLKSVLSSVAFPAFVLGHNPATKILCASYSAELAIKHANDFRAVMRSERYRRLFPGTQISSEKNTELELMTTKRGRPLRHFSRRHRNRPRRQYHHSR